jgi:hypothetical protein
MDESPQADPKRIRLGLGVLGLVVVFCLVAARQTDAVGPRLLLGAIGIFTLVRLFFLMRTLRRDG